MCWHLVILIHISWINWGQSLILSLSCKFACPYLVHWYCKLHFYFFNSCVSSEFLLAYIRPHLCKGKITKISSFLWMLLADSWVCLWFANKGIIISLNSLQKGKTAWIVISSFRETTCTIWIWVNSSVLIQRLYLVWSWLQNPQLISHEFRNPFFYSTSTQ